MTGVWVGWSYLLTAVGVTGLLLSGSKRTVGWAVGFAAQGLWVVYALATRQHGFLLSAAVYGATYARNWLRWRRDERPGRPSSSGEAGRAAWAAYVVRGGRVPAGSSPHIRAPRASEVGPGWRGQVAPHRAPETSVSDVRPQPPPR